MIRFLSPAMAKPLGEHAMRASVLRTSVTKACYRNNFRFHAPIYTIFDPVMQPTIASDLDIPLTYFLGLF